MLWGQDMVNLYKRKLVCPIISHDPTLIDGNTWDLFISQKVVIRGVATALTATYDSEGCGLLVAMHSAQPSGQYSPLFLTSIINARLLNWVHLIKYYSGRIPEGSLRYPVSFLERLPIRHISFTTPQEERERLIKIGITAATEWIESTEGLSVSFSLFSGSNLGRWLDARLTAEPEQSDVVHDLLAHLAEQMIEMNKQKQAEVRGFLDWLADYTGLAVEDWALKTSLKAYYEQDWEEMRRVLDRNRRQVKKVDVVRREASGRIRHEWEASVGKLRPLLARIAATDWLIDQIVYRLYGLTEEEVAVVEGNP